MHDRVGFEEGRQLGASSCAPIAGAGPKVQLGNSHERENAEFSV